MRSMIVRPASYSPAFRRFTSPKRTLALISLALTALAVVRVVVCIVESYSAVAQERADDEELMAMCAAPSGARSADFRALCMKKRAERASPIVFKAVLRAVTAAFCDFAEAFGSPARIALLVLFCLTGVSAPVAKAIAAIFVQNMRRRRHARATAHDDSDTDEDEEGGDGRVQIVDVGESFNRKHYNTRQRLQRSLRRSLRLAAEKCGVEPLELDFMSDAKQD
jgi:hypothetical protein